MKKGVVRFFDGKSINFSRKTERIFQKLEFFTWGLRLGRQPRGPSRLSTPPACQSINRLLNISSWQQHSTIYKQVLRLVDILLQLP